MGMVVFVIIDIIYIAAIEITRSVLGGPCVRKMEHEPQRHSRSTITPVAAADGCRRENVTS